LSARRFGVDERVALQRREASVGGRHQRPEARPYPHVGSRVVRQRPAGIHPRPLVEQPDRFVAQRRQGTGHLGRHRPPHRDQGVEHPLGLVAGPGRRAALDVLQDQRHPVTRVHDAEQAGQRQVAPRQCRQHRRLAPGQTDGVGVGGGGDGLDERPPSVRQPEAVGAAR